MEDILMQCEDGINIDFIFSSPQTKGNFLRIAEINIKLIARGDCFYDITKIENITDGTDGQALIKATISADDVSNISIPDSVEKINSSDENSEKNFSLRSFPE